MIIKPKVEKSKKGLDNLIPPNPTITFEPSEDQIKVVGVMAAIGLALGFIALGFSLYGV